MSFPALVVASLPFCLKGFLSHLLFLHRDNLVHLGVTLLKVLNSPLEGFLVVYTSPEEGNKLSFLEQPLSPVRWQPVSGQWGKCHLLFLSSVATHGISSLCSSMTQLASIQWKQHKAGLEQQGLSYLVPLTQRVSRLIMEDKLSSLSEKREVCKERTNSVFLHLSSPLYSPFLCLLPTFLVTQDSCALGSSEQLHSVMALMRHG